VRWAQDRGRGTGARRLLLHCMQPFALDWIASQRGPSAPQLYQSAPRGGFRNKLVHCLFIIAYFFSWFYRTKQVDPPSTHSSQANN